MAKDKKKKQSTIYFNIKLTNDYNQNLEEQVNEHMQNGGTSIYTFYNTYVYVPFNNKIKEKEFKQVEEALQKKDFTILPLRPVVYEETTTKQSLYACFPQKDTSNRNHSWIYMSIYDYIKCIETSEKSFDIVLILSKTNIIIPRVLWPELKLLYNDEVVTIPPKEEQAIVVDGKYQLVNIEDEINMDFFKALMAYKQNPTEELHDQLTNLLDESNLTVYMPIDLVLKDESIEQFKVDLVNLNYTTTLSKSIFESELGKVVLVYTSKRYIPESLKQQYTWVSINFMEAYRLLSYDHEFDCIIFNYLNSGFRANKDGLDELYYEAFALGNVIELDPFEQAALSEVLDEFNIEEAYIYEAYNRIGNAILYKGDVEPSQVRYRLQQVFPTETIFTNVIDRYEIVTKGEPFFKK